AFDLADQLSNFLDLGKSLTLAAAQKYKENVDNFRILSIQPEEIDATENRFLKSIYEYATLADSLSFIADGQRQYYENLFKETEKVDYEDAYLIFDEHHFALSDGAQELLKLGYETSQELQIINKWSRKISLALLHKNPEEFAEKLGYAVETKSIASSSDWLVSSEFNEGWQEFSFIDSQWQHAYNEGPATNIMESGAESIWLVNIDKSQITELDSSTAINQVATARDVAPNKLSQVLNRPNEVYFRKSFNIEGLPVSGILQLFLDDSYTVFLNGQLVEEFEYDSTSTLSTRTHTISDYLQSGKNVIAIKVHDSDDSHGSLEAVLEVKNIPDWFQNQEGTERERN
ncbi:MAG: hypothetical protein ACE5HX_06545, partial [bacterium]